MDRGFNLTLRTVFLGTAPFGFPVMRSLANDRRIETAGVFTQPDRKRGRGQEPQSPPVAEFAKELDLPLYQPDDINRDGLEELRNIGSVDLGIVIAYGQILNETLLEMPGEGFFNFHASLLPRWRGAAPIRHTLMAGDERTGVSVFRIVEELDSGPVCVKLETQIRENETYGGLYERLSQVNVGALKVLLSDIESGKLSCSPQIGEPTYADKITSDDAKIQWDRSVEALERFVRAFDPDPGAFTYYDGDRLKIYRVESVNATDNIGSPGEIIDLTNEGIIVAAGSGALKLLEVQPSGSTRMGVESFIAGGPELSVGDRLGVSSE